jgi:hypothetical protein
MVLYKQHKQNHNVEEHERVDDIEYRKRFLDRMFQYEKRMFKYIGDDCEVVFLLILLKVFDSFRTNHVSLLMKADRPYGCRRTRPFFAQKDQDVI